MSNAPQFDIDMGEFAADPYPTLTKLREKAPIAFIPQLGATMLTRHADVVKHEKMVDIFSSVMPDSLLTKIQGQHMLRKDGDDHLAERRAIFPTVSPKTVRRVWKEKFKAQMTALLDELAPKGEACAVRDIGMPIAGEMLRIVTVLTNMTWADMDRTSQAMMDGIANVIGVPEIAEKCDGATAEIEQRIRERIPEVEAEPDYSMLSVLLQAGMELGQIDANIKLTIGGGQNEPRDAISGTLYGLLSDPEQLEMIHSGQATHVQAFSEYVRWVAPIGMATRRLTQDFHVGDYALKAEDKVYFSYASCNRDEAVFNNPHAFDMRQDSAKSVAFGAGPHFCAGAVISRTLVGEVVLPMVFERLKGLRRAGEAKFAGWFFRGPTHMPVAWDV